VLSNKIHIAFIAEFSRGKSELINALFFSHYQKRIIPTSSGRTTMCPTEFIYDNKKPIGIELLPIETHIHQVGTADLINHTNLWQSISFDVHNDVEMTKAFQHLTETIWVSEEDAQAYGLYDAQNTEYYNLNNDGQVEISRWRHAVINFPHPLLEQGLVIIDTPGLNAIGSEPELALRLIPESHIIVFMLAADTGVTKTDLELWRSHVQPHQQNSSLVILNKIDTLLDPLKSAQEHTQEIHKQMTQTAKYFDISPEQIYPISAKQGFLAKINQDTDAYHKSGLAFLEEVLVSTIIPKRQTILREQIEHLLMRLFKVSIHFIAEEKKEVSGKLSELSIIESKDAKNINYTLKKLKIEKDDFNELSLNYQAMRSMFNKQSSQLLELLHALENHKIDDQSNAIRQQFKKHTSNSLLKQEINTLFTYVEQNLDIIAQHIKDINDAAESIYAKLNQDLACNLSITEHFDMQAYQKNLHDIHQIYQAQFGGVHFLRFNKAKLMQRFLDTVVTRLRQLFLNLSKNAEFWISGLLTPSDVALSKQEKKIKEMIELVTQTSINTDVIHYNKTQLELKLQECNTQMLYTQNQQTKILNDLYINS
jgi:Dynamin family